VNDRNAHSIEPTVEAEAEWVKLVTGATAMSEYQNTCTPGYYNGEGTNEGQGFLQTNYPDGGLPFSPCSLAGANKGISRGSL
jgi:hypothetical protein